MRETPHWRYPPMDGHLAPKLDTLRAVVDEATEHPAEPALAAPAFAYVDFGVAHGLSRDMLMQQSRLTNVAFELGYADLKSFYRAFRRWTETTPADWRARNA